ncbi:MAG: TerC family protein [Nitrospirota bacterium]|jgi:predicted tellurium resistance membrane protein TerC
MEYVIALIALTAMEIVLGIDNIVFIAILTSRLPVGQQPRARRIGLGLAMVTRILLLLTLSAMLRLTGPLFHLSALGVPAAWLNEAVDAVSGKDLILLAGGLFLIWKSVTEIHERVEGGEHDRAAGGNASCVGVLATIAVMDLVFSIDSVITAVGMVRTEGSSYWLGIAVMVTAIVLAVVVMMIFAEPISRFIEAHPTLKMLALSFLLLIGVMLVAEGIGTHIDKGYIYFAMAFSLVVEGLNLRVRARSAGHPTTAQ